VEPVQRQMRGETCVSLSLSLSLSLCVRERGRHNEMWPWFAWYIQNVMSTSISPQRVRWDPWSVCPCTGVSLCACCLHVLHECHRKPLRGPAWIYPRGHYSVTFTHRGITCDTLDGFKKKMGFRCDNYYMCLLFPPSSSSDVLLAPLLLTSSCWLAAMRDGRTGAELHVARCNVAIWYRHICYLPYRIGGRVSVPVGYLFILPVSFKGYTITVLIIVHTRAGMITYKGCALGCPQMLSRGDTLFILMMNVFPGVLYHAAQSTCSTGSVVGHLVVATVQTCMWYFVMLDRCFHFMDMILPKLEVKWKLQNNDFLSAWYCAEFKQTWTIYRRHL